jgi:GDP-mannose 4,6-dehydratase
MSENVALIMGVTSQDGAYLTELLLGKGYNRARNEAPLVRAQFAASRSSLHRPLIGMWAMMQQPKADDYVLATGESHSVREFVERAFAVIGRRIRWRGQGTDEVGIDDVTGEELVKVDPRYFRPTEVNALCGDPSEARAKLGWKHKVTFDDLVTEMVSEDLRALRTGG